MYAITFDLQVCVLEQTYGQPYNKAYYEIKKILKLMALNGCKEALI